MRWFAISHVCGTECHSYNIRYIQTIKFVFWCIGWMDGMKRMQFHRTMIMMMAKTSHIPMAIAVAMAMAMLTLNLMLTFPRCLRIWNWGQLSDTTRMYHQLQNMPHVENFISVASFCDFQTIENDDDDDFRQRCRNPTRKRERKKNTEEK